MTPTLALLLITIITVALFHLVDWIFWGTTWTHRNVFAYVPKEMWRLPADPTKQKEAGKRAMMLGALVTTFAAIVFVPMVWLIGPRFAGARVIILALLLWAAFTLSGAFYNSIYYRIPTQMMWLQAWASLARILIGLVAITWLLTRFNAW